MRSWFWLAFAAMLIGGFWRVAMKLCVAKTGWATTNLILALSDVVLILPIIWIALRNGEKVEWNWPWWGLAVIAGLLATVNCMLVTWALKTGPVNMVSLIHGSAPMVAAIAGTVLLKEKMTVEQWAGAALMGAGLMLLMFGKAVAPAPH